MLSPNASSEKVRIDSKGRISIPAYLRRNFGLEIGDKVELFFDLKRNLFVVVFKPKVFYGQSGVIDSTGDCGSSGLGAIPGSGPKEGKTRVKGPSQSNFRGCDYGDKKL